VEEDIVKVAVWVLLALWGIAALTLIVGGLLRLFRKD
jgi:hypothetical protein